MRLIGSIWLCLFASIQAKGQYAPELEDYKRWGLHFDKVLYLPAQANKKYGVYDIDTKIMPGIGFGFEYVFHPQNSWSFFTGLGMDFLPFTNYSFSIKKADLPNENWPYDAYSSTIESVNKHNVLSIPTGVKLNQQISNRIFWSTAAFIKNTFIQYGSFEQNIISYNTSMNNQEVYILSIIAYSNANNIWYPSINLHTGLSFMSRYALIRLDAKFQKTFFPYFKGEYRFYNLKNVQDTYGTYKVQGDYFGLGITVTPRKIKTLKY